MRSMIKEYINHDTPFGPIDANSIDIRHEGEMKELFDQENRICKNAFDRPSVIIGRKGSGKTAYLRSVYLDSTYAYVIKPNPAKAFIKVMGALDAKESETAFAELIAELWEKLFYCALFAKLIAEKAVSGEDLSQLQGYLASIGVRDRCTPDDILWTIVETITDASPGSALGILLKTFMNVASVTGANFDECSDIADSALSRSNKKAVILIDSLDDYYSIDAQNFRFALKGLFKCVGEFNKAGRLFDVRLCLPAELYHIFSEISVNPAKDFSRNVAIQWRAKELVCIAAQRLVLYLKNYYPDFYSPFYHLKCEDYKDALHLFHAVFPETIENSIGIKEKTLFYILRHTQLLPRHFIKHLNAIFAYQRRSDQNFFPKMPAKAIQEGVRSNDDNLCKEIFSAFSYRYPTAGKVCNDCIPELPFCFSHGELQKVFNSRGKKAMGNNDFYEFKKMLIEIGAVGQVIGNKTEKYIKGVFEYTLPHHLFTSTKDELCLHPAFIKVFCARRELCRDGIMRSVYPYGTDVDDVVVGD